MPTIIKDVSFLVPVHTIQLYVRGIDGQTILVNATPDTQILTIKQQLADKTGIPLLSQRLVFGNKDLKDTAMVQDTKLQHESSLELMLRLKGGIGEVEALQAFLEASIAHGNVDGLIDKESEVLMTYWRNENMQQTIYEKMKDNLPFNKEYAKEELQFDCAIALAVEALGVGNCTEMSEWAMVQLIENTKDQQVYMCSLEGQFDLKKDIDPTDENHVLYDPKKQAVSNEFDHMFVITYPEKCEAKDMDWEKAIVVDAWYNNLVCTLKDYLTSKHPYYEYKFADLDKGNIVLDKKAVKVERSYAAIGTPCSNDKKRFQTYFSNARMLNTMMAKNKEVELPAQKFEFEVDNQVHDKR